MSKSRILYIMLFLWLFAIFAPSVISLLSEEHTSLLTINLSEKEQQEQEKNNIDEKLIVEGADTNFSDLSHLQSSLSYNFYILENSEHISEIILPPPEYFI